MALKRSNNNSPIWSVLRLFFLQPLTASEMPHHLRGRVVLMLILILIVLYSSLFSSGVITQMVKPRYEPGIQTEDDIEKHGLLKLNYSTDDVTIFDKIGNLSVVNSCI